MFTCVYICRTCAILRKNKINIVLFEQHRMSVIPGIWLEGWAVKCAVVSLSGWNCVWSIYCWIESLCAYLDTFWDYLFT